MTETVVLWSRVIPAGAYTADEEIPLLPQKVRRMSARRRKKWIRARIAAAAIRKAT